MELVYRQNLVRITNDGGEGGVRESKRIWIGFAF